MTPQILYSDNHQHQLFLDQWNEAVAIHNALLDWKEANPRADTDFSDWWDQLRIEEQRLGLNTDIGSANHDKGRIRIDSRYGTPVLKLRRLIRDFDDNPILGDRLVRCAHCDTLFATFNQHDHHCSAACKDAAQAKRLEAKAERRKQRQAERSTALASRSGICLACGNQFTLKRITAKTCSDTCRKRLQRKPDLAAEHLQLLPIAPDLKDAIAAQKQHSNAALKLRLASIGTELDTEQQALLTKIENYLDQVNPKIAEQHRRNYLNAIAQHAPSLGAWLMAQPEETQRAACLDWDGIQKVLGPALSKKVVATQEAAQAAP